MTYNGPPKGFRGTTVFPMEYNRNRPHESYQAFNENWYRQLHPATESETREIFQEQEVMRKLLNEAKGVLVK